MAADDDDRLAERARRGDADALGELIRRCLPVVHSFVRRTLDPADADDVVQETLVRAFRGIGGLRDPERFRSWLLTIAVHETRRRLRARGDAALVPLWDDGEPDPGGRHEVEERVLARLALSELRREVSAATAWLEPADRELLGLWWLEVIGELSRTQLAEAAGITVAHAGVRVHRVRARLDEARSVVRALAAGCPVLRMEYGGGPSPATRVRLLRHVEACPRCRPAGQGLVAPDRLLAGIGLLAPAAALFDGVGTLTAGLTGAAVPAAGTAVGTGGLVGVATTPLAGALAVVVVGTGLVVGTAMLAPSPGTAPMARAAPAASGPGSPSAAVDPPAATAGAPTSTAPTTTPSPTGGSTAVPDPSPGGGGPPVVVSAGNVAGTADPGLLAAARAAGVAPDLHHSVWLRQTTAARAAFGAAVVDTPVITTRFGYGGDEWARAYRTDYLAYGMRADTVCVNGLPDTAAEWTTYTGSLTDLGVRFVGPVFAPGNSWSDGPVTDPGYAVERAAIEASGGFCAEVIPSHFWRAGPAHQANLLASLTWARERGYEVQIVVSPAGRDADLLADTRRFAEELDARGLRPTRWIVESASTADGGDVPETALWLAEHVGGGR